MNQGPEGQLQQREHLQQAATTQALHHLENANFRPINTACGGTTGPATAAGAGTTSVQLATNGLRSSCRPAGKTITKMRHLDHEDRCRPHTIT